MRLKLILRVFTRMKKVYGLNMQCWKCAKQFEVDEVIVRFHGTFYGADSTRKPKTRLFCLEHEALAHDDPVRGRLAHWRSDCEDCAEAQNIRTWLRYGSRDTWYCIYHKAWHCDKHAMRCASLHGNRLVKSFSAKAREAIEGRDWQALGKCFVTDDENKEYCKFSTWEEQLALKMFICAECKQSACECKNSTQLEIEE